MSLSSCCWPSGVFRGSGCDRLSYPVSLLASACVENIIQLQNIEVFLEVESWFISHVVHQSPFMFTILWMLISRITIHIHGIACIFHTQLPKDLKITFPKTFFFRNLEGLCVWNIFVTIHGIAYVFDTQELRIHSQCFS